MTLYIYKQRLINKFQSTILKWRGEEGAPIKNKNHMLENCKRAMTTTSNRDNVV